MYDKFMHTKKKKVFLATANEGKIQRFKHLLKEAGVEVEIHTPKDFGLEKIEVEEGSNFNRPGIRRNSYRKIVEKHWMKRS